MKWVAGRKAAEKREQSYGAVQNLVDAQNAAYLSATASQNAPKAGKRPLAFNEADLQDGDSADEWAAGGAQATELNRLLAQE